MHAVSDSTPRRRRLALFSLALVFALAASLASGSMAWLLIVLPPVFMPWRSRDAGLQATSDQAQYGVGAALAGFTPVRRD